MVRDDETEIKIVKDCKEAVLTNVDYVLMENEILKKENQWLYGKLNQIGDLIERGRDESKIYVPPKLDTHPNT